MGIEMIRVDTTIPDIDIKDGTISSAIRRTPNPRMFAMIQIKNGFLTKPNC
jgi:hypothetical protein